MELINLSQITPTKSNIEIVANNIINPVLNGEMNKVEFVVKSKFISEVLAKCAKSINLELQQHESYMGAKVEPTETGVKYHYNQCEEWNNLQEQIKPLLEKQKAIEEQIKMATKIGKSFVDESTGETISPVTKESTSSYKITLGK